MVIEKLQQGISNILIATGQLIGEGFDLPQLSSVFLTTPIKFDGKLQQIIGRIVRIAEGKEKAIIYDFSDNNWLLQHNLKSRMEFYKKEGIL
jgi:superfamily II DNA or RNA helicase